MLNATDEILLIALRKGKHFKANPGDPETLLSAAHGEIEALEAQSSGRRLHADGLAVFVRDDERPGLPLLRITDTGMAYADLLIAARRKKTFRERIKAVPRSDWMAFVALVVSIVALFKPG